MLKDNYQLHLFMETSAKTGINAKEMFIKCAEVLYKDYLQYNRNKPQGEDSTNPISNQLQPFDTPGKGRTQKKKCCQ